MPRWMAISIPSMPGSAEQLFPSTLKENEHVKADSVVAQLDQRDYELAVARAEAEFADAEAVVVAARANVPIASSNAGTQISSSAAATTRAHANVEAATREVMAAQSRVGAAKPGSREAQAPQLKPHGISSE